MTKIRVERPLPLDETETAYLEAYNAFREAHLHMQANYAQYSTRQASNLITKALSFDMNKIMHLQARLDFFGIENGYGREEK